VPLRRSLSQAFQQWAQAIAATLAEARDGGALRADLDPDTTARFLLSAWEGALINARVDRSANAFDSFFDIAFGALLAP
jgi:TetR/AcrR family transcriptional repressor of nem operon